LRGQDWQNPKLNIPTGIPLVYGLNDDLRAINHYYLGDEETINKATDAVARQLHEAKD